MHVGADFKPAPTLRNTTMEYYQLLGALEFWLSDFDFLADLGHSLHILDRFVHFV
jgi:hypothetical protein